jgi:hypothetical protein
VSYRTGIVGIIFIRKLRPDKVSGAQRDFHDLLEKPQALLIIFIALVRIALHFIIIQAEPSRSARHILKGSDVLGVPANEPFKEGIDVKIIHSRRPLGSLKNIVSDFDLARTHSAFP